jgi:AraC-like DNA-binding protein
MINDETSADRTARAMVLRRLLEVLLIEALRSTGGAAAPPGLLRGMADPLLAPTLRRIHADPGRSMTVEALAQDAAMSRSTFFDRLRREVGVPPMEYATGWPRPGEGTPSQGRGHGGDCATRRLRLGERFQRRLHPPCREATGGLFTGKHGSTELPQETAPRTAY